MRFPELGQAPGVALLGRPNVGKSTLFNRLIRSNRAITHDRPGITRDRLVGVVHPGRPDAFLLIDTGGVSLGGGKTLAPGPDGLRGFEEAVLAQAMEAVAEAALLCLVVDAREGLTPFDERLAAFLRKTAKPLLLVVNKVDGPERADLLLADFHGLGLDPVPCSAAHGYNLRALEDLLSQRLFAPASAGGPEAGSGLAEYSAPFSGASGEIAPVPALPSLPAPPLPEEDAPCAPQAGLAPSAADGPLRLAVLGRPNAGKSSLVNAMAGKERMIVSDLPGTTRDSVDVPVSLNGLSCVFVDTPGVRRPAQITDTLERYSVNSSLKSASKAEVTLLVLDASEGITQQDKRLIDLLHERRTPFLALMNKSDLFSAGERADLEKNFRRTLDFCAHVPLLFISALKQRNLGKIIPLAGKIRRECGLRIGTGLLNRALSLVLEQHQPPLLRRARARFFYLTPAETRPPTFVFFVSDAERVPPAYRRYLERALRSRFGIAHAPIRLHFRSSHAKDAPGGTSRRRP
ncbi:MAG: ribosome biogenesis GTPase Der [Deltaproteobacteria bacterium]|nr:ribosome biogenesis GTPase Der [Deltaproteobacteria bacterium]